MTEKIVIIILVLLLIVSNIACFLACEKIIDEWSELCLKRSVMNEI